MKRIFLIFSVIIAAILVLALARSYSADGNAEDSQRPTMAVKQQMSSATQKAPVIADSSRYSVVKGLAALQRISKKADIDLCDLSHQGLKEIPNLRDYRIKRLDLSHNELVYLSVSDLPRSIRWLDISYCKIGDEEVGRKNKIRSDAYYLEIDSLPYLREIDCSHNQIKYLWIDKEVRWLDASYNRLIELSIIDPNSWEKKLRQKDPNAIVILSSSYYLRETDLRFLDISHNPDFDTLQTTDFSTVKTFRRANTAGGKRIRQRKLVL